VFYQSKILRCSGTGQKPKNVLPISVVTRLFNEILSRGINV
jgi:hypothetical protein